MCWGNLLNPSFQSALKRQRCLLCVYIGVCVCRCDAEEGGALHTVPSGKPSVCAGPLLFVLLCIHVNNSAGLLSPRTNSALFLAQRQREFVYA